MYTRSMSLMFVVLAGMFVVGLGVSSVHAETIYYDHYWASSALPEDSDPAWTLRDNGPDIGDNRWLVGNDYLRIDTPATGGDGDHDDAYCDFEILGQTTLADFTQSSTVDFTMRVNSQSEGVYVNGLTVYVPEGANTRFYSVTLDDTKVGLAAVYEDLDTSVWHDYRLSINPSTHVANLYVDGSATPLLTTSTGSTINNFDRNGLIWGDTGNTSAGVADWSFVAWTNQGAYPGDVQLSIIPEPSTLVLLAAGFVGLVLFRWRRKRNIAN